jgi:hypothetical protein
MLKLKIKQVPKIFEGTPQPYYRLKKPLSKTLLPIKKKTNERLGKSL